MIAARIHAVPLPAALRGVWLWIWDTPPAPHALDGARGAFVRAANGGSTVGGGFDFAHNYAQWVSSYGVSRCIAWTYVYGDSDGGGAHTDGTHAAHVLADAAPHAPAYIADIEGNVTPANAQAFVATLRALRPGVPIGFSSYPTKNQAESFHVPWQTVFDACDFSAPQVYEPYQQALLDQVYADHAGTVGHPGKAVHVAVAPPDAPGWVATGVVAMTRSGGASIWRGPVQPGWTNGVATIAHTPLGGVTSTDVTVTLPILDLRGAANQPITDPSVPNLKALLVAHGTLNSPAPWTREADGAVHDAVVTFQQNTSLTADAIVGPATWGALLSSQL
jgi:hypothetical protein